MSREGRGWALVTGAGQGLGRAFARDLARRGFDLLLVSLPGSGLEELARELRALHRCEVLGLSADLTEPSARAELVALVEARGVPLAMLVNNAGTGGKGAFGSRDFQDWRTSISLNILATAELTHALLPLLERARPSVVLNVASLAAFFPMPYFGVYASTKAFLLHWSLALRSELLPRGVTVTALAPGAIWTNREVSADIEAQGWMGRMAARWPDQVAREAVDGALRGRALVIPGLFNRLMMLGSLVPKRLVASLVGRRYRQLYGATS